MEIPDQDKDTTEPRTEHGESVRPQPTHQKLQCGANLMWLGGFIVLGGASILYAAHASGILVLELVGLGVIGLMILAGLILFLVGYGRRRQAEEPVESPATPAPCSKCGGSVETRRRPLTVRDLLAIVGLVVLGWGFLASLRFPWGRPYPWYLVLCLWSVGLQPLLQGLQNSDRYRRMPRCVECWTPVAPSRRPRRNFWVRYLQSLILFLLLYLAIVLLGYFWVPD